ncbi:MAG: hypothetical protein ABIS14_04990 [Sphingomonas sp.]
MLTLAAASIGIWIGLKITKGRVGLLAVQQTTIRRFAVAALLTGAVVLGLWIGSHGRMNDPSLIALGILLWAAAMYSAFRRRKRP